MLSLLFERKAYLIMKLSQEKTFLKMMIISCVTKQLGLQ